MRKLFLVMEFEFRARIVFVVLSGLLVMGLGAWPAAAAIGKRAERYQVCLDMVDRSPEAALEQARNWQGERGGVAALHCEALALLALGKREEAARKLEAIARDRGAGGMIERAAILNQAGNAWLLAGRLDEATSSLSSAIALDPGNKDYYIDRASAHHFSGDWSSAISDLTSAIALDSRDVLALILRAAAYREKGELTRAGDDIARALVLDPDNDEALREQARQRDLAAGRKIQSD